MVYRDTNWVSSYRARHYYAVWRKERMIYRPFTTHSKVGEIYPSLQAGLKSSTIVGRLLSGISKKHEIDFHRLGYWHLGLTNYHINGLPLHLVEAGFIVQFGPGKKGRIVQVDTMLSVWHNTGGAPLFSKLAKTSQQKFNITLDTLGLITEGTLVV